MAAIGVSAGKLGIDADRLVEIGKGEIEIAFFHVDPGAGAILVVLEGEAAPAALT